MNEPIESKLTLRTIAEFLLFRASAIRTVAASPIATWVGLLFVVAAGFAREYDGEYLVAEPWHVALPLLASLIGSFLLTVLVFGMAYCRNVRDVGFLTTFGAILNVYWMMAPMALLYAIPVERFLSPGNATRANLGLLAIVAIWRVLLTVRCVSVIYKAPWFVALIPVMLFSDALALLALNFIPGPIFMIMGGVRLTESEQLILDIRLSLGFAGILSAPIWLLGYLFCCASKKLISWHWQLPDATSTNRASRGLRTAVLASLVVWIPILPFTQPEQRLRWTSEKLLRNNQFAKVSELSRSHSRDKFPPHWDPPPRIGYGESSPNLHLAALGLQSNNAAAWFSDLFRDKLKANAKMIGQFHLPQSLHQMTDDEVKIYADLLTSMDNGEELASELVEIIESMLTRQGADDANDYWHVSAEKRVALKRILKLAETQN